jgi:peptidoglycan/LPS O-acetylase OafA/YrhL
MPIDSGSPAADRPPADAAPADPHETFLRTANFSALNGLRCFCCLAVIKEHVKWDLPWPRLMTVGYGGLGVDLFFGISGFLIVTLLIRERERRQSISLTKFYARRTLRIFPIYYLMISVVLFAYLVVSPWAPNGLNFYLAALPVLLTYTQDVIRVTLGNFFHCWSLAMEEQFYLCWPAVEKYAPRALRWTTLGALLVLNQGINFGAFDDFIIGTYGDPDAVRMQIYLITFTPILLGVLLAHLMNQRRGFTALYWLVGWKCSPFIFLAILVAVCELAPSVTRGAPRLFVHVTLALLLGSLVAREDNYARPILVFPPVARVGVISYGVYLYHVWVIEAVTFLHGRLHLSGGNGFGTFALVTVGTVAVAELSFRRIEQPLLKYKKYFHS